MENKTIALNEQEAKALLSLIDIAVKAHGMKAAQAGVHLSDKINKAFAKTEEPEEVTPEVVEKPKKK